MFILALLAACGGREETPDIEEQKQESQSQEPVTPTKERKPDRIKTAVIPATSYRTVAEQYAPHLSAAELDGKHGLSQEEYLAIGQTLDAWEGVNVEMVATQSELQGAMKTELVQNYQALLAGKRGEQIVFIDLAALEEFYDTSFRPFTKKSLEEFKIDLKEDLQKRFVHPDGIAFDIQFLFEEPTEGEFITVHFTTDKFSSIVASSEKVRQKYVKFAMIQGGANSERRQVLTAMYQELKRQNPEASEEQIVDAIVQTRYFQSDLQSKDNVLATTIRNEDVSFGNPSDSEYVWMDASKFYLGLNPPPRVKTSLQPWINQSPRGLSRLASETMAHEVGHALGLVHSSQALTRRRYKVKLNRSSHLMDAFGGIDPKQPKGDLRFSDFAMDYLKFTLGERS